MNSGTMMLNIETTFLLFLGFFIIATFYSSVGFGGGSSYLALLSVFAFSFFTKISTTYFSGSNSEKFLSKG